MEIWFHHENHNATLVAKILEVRLHYAQVVVLLAFLYNMMCIVHLKKLANDMPEKSQELPKACKCCRVYLTMLLTAEFLNSWSD